MPQYVLLKGFPEYAAANIADAQTLYTALLDPATDTNALTIARITQRLPPLCIADTAVPLVIDSIDDAAGTRSSWVTNATASLAFAIGDADPALSHRYASANVSNISSNTRVGNLVLATSNLFAAMSGSFGHPQRGMSKQFTAHIQQTDALGFTQTFGLLPVTIEPGVFGTYPTGDPDQGVLANYVTFAAANAALANIAAANANTYAFASLGYSQNAQTYANYASNSANSASGYANTAANLVANLLQTLTWGTNIAWDLTYRVAEVTMLGNANLTVSNIKAGETYLLHAKQNAAGNWTLAFPAANFAWPGNIAPTLTTTANCRDIFSFTANTTLLFGGYVQNYAQ